MSKNIEKLAKEKDLEKIKPEKEKHEPKEIKEDKEDKEAKEQKERKEHKEHKDVKDTKAEIKERNDTTKDFSREKAPKEGKDLKDRKEILKAESKELYETTKDFSREKAPKEIFEGKDLVEQPDLPDLSGQPVSTLRADASSSIAKAAEKQIDKIKAEKEFTKHEPKEIKEPKEFKDKDFKDHKDQKDNKEHKEHKDQKDNKEHKEHKDLKDRKEIHKELEREVNKDFKEFAKELEKFPKEIDEKGFVETGPEIPGGPAQSAESTTMEARLARLEGVAKQLEKAGEKNIEKKLEKVEHKDKFEKFEHKDKFEKIERKEFKIEKPEHGKEFIAEKLIEVGIDPGPLGPDPAQRGFEKFEATGTVEERVSRLENALLRMSHFIGVDLRPDLSAGALNREPDVAPPPPTKPSVAPPPPTKPDVAPPPPTKTEPNKPK